jgi:hypothetical protein
VDVLIHIFLTSVIAGGEWSASRPGRSTPGNEPLVSIGQEPSGPQSQYGRRGENS